MKPIWKPAVLTLMIYLGTGLAGSAAVAKASAAKSRAITLSAYRDRVHAAWIGGIIGTIYGWPFEGQPRNTMMLDHYLRSYSFAPVDDDYYYEMVALYGFERYGLGMTVEQLGAMWKEYQAGSWGSSEQARLLLAKGIRAPFTGEPRYNRWFHTIGPQFSSDIYGMISPGMVNLAGHVARTYSHVNGYAEGSDGAVFVAACISEAFLETDTLKIVRQAAQLINPGSNYRKALDQVLEGYAAGKDWRQLAQETEARWRPDYPQMNNSVANGALVAIALIYGRGDYLKSLNIVTQADDYTDADCDADNVGSVLGAIQGMKTIPQQLAGPLNDRIYGDRLGSVQFNKVVDERISDLAARIAVWGEKHVLANGATLRRQAGEDALIIPQQVAQTQPLEYFDINDYGPLWNRDWRLAGAGRGGAGATYLDGDVLVTFPRDTRPCRLEREMVLPTRQAQLLLDAGYEPGRPWRLQILVDDDSVANQVIGNDIPAKGLQWLELRFDLSKYAGQARKIRLYQFLVDGKAPGSAYWRSVRIQNGQ